MLDRMARSCPRLRFDVERLSGETIKAVRIEARARDMDARGRVNRLLGAITVTKRSDASGIGPQVVGVPYASHVEVDPEVRRCGIATALYEAAARAACKEFKAPLHSDKERSRAAQGFWQKQIAKGRAVCIKATEPGRDDYEGPISNRGGCELYKLSCPAPKSLARGSARRGSRATSTAARDRRSPSKRQA